MVRKVVIVSWLVLAACGDDGGGSGTDAAGQDGDACAKLWTVTENGGTATVEGGALRLAAPTIASGVAAQVVQAGLTGDFDVTFAVEGFTSGGTGAYLQAVLAADVTSPTSFASAGIGTNPIIGVSAAFQPGTVDLEASSGTAPSFRFARVGATLTVTATSGAEQATVADAFATSPLQIGLQLGTNAGTIGAATSVRITAFTVAAGAGVTADAFACDSLIR